MERRVYESLAELLTYPEVQLPDICHSERAGAPGAPASGALGWGSEESAVHSQLDYFREQVRPLSLPDLQELFIQTFDLSPVCSLEMGWHLFGENYDRGLLLVKMRQQLRQYGVPETTELPDHLTNALRLLSRMERDAGAYFAEAVVLPALEKMLEAIRRQNNPYEHVLNAVRLAVRADFPDLPPHLSIPVGAPELRILA